MNHADIADLDRRFGIPGVARIVPGNGGLAKLVVTAPAASGEVYLHGAHVTSWRPAGAEEVLFVSSQSHWEPDRAIRGGVPVCFPWFAAKSDDPHAPAHGLVRTKPWQLDSIGQSGDAVTIAMSIASSVAMKPWYPGDFELSLRATFGCELRLELAAANTGSTPLRFEEALHTYFRVGNISDVEVLGLSGTRYLDKTDSNRQKTQDGAVKIVSETDRVYLGTTGTVELADTRLGRRIRVAKENSRTTVVWNPWIAKSRAMSDFGDEEWPGMICIETANAGDFAVELQPGERHVMTAICRLDTGV